MDITEQVLARLQLQCAHDQLAAEKKRTDALLQRQVQYTNNKWDSDNGWYWWLNGYVAASLVAAGDLCFALLP